MIAIPAFYLTDIAPDLRRADITFERRNVCL